MIGVIRATIPVAVALVCSTASAAPLEWKRALRQREPGEHDTHDLHARAMLIRAIRLIRGSFSDLEKIVESLAPKESAAAAK